MTSLSQRQSGVLLHVTSLPGPFKHGVLGQEALQFIKHIQYAGYRVWQFLPLGPTHAHGSPYESLSSSAGNPELIDLRQVSQHGWLSDRHVQRVISGELLPCTARAKAALKFYKQLEGDTELSQQLTDFKQQQASWLDDYALFTSLKIVHEGMPWWKWSVALRDKQTAAIRSAKETLSAHIQQVVFEQFMFHQQWQRIKEHAEHCGVQLFGDLPIYVAHDSSDVWANREYFTVNDEGFCDEVAGVPPDYFSETGQRWGNPLYVWDTLQASGFEWWIERIEVQMQRMHIIRIDHFRGLEAFWSIPAHRDDGIEGKWRKALGRELLQALSDRFGKQLPFIAEDLGLITPEVTALRQDFGLPGMKILHFAFGGDASNPYLPHQHTQDMVVYTGTHDNDTTLGWWQAASDHEQQHIQSYLGMDGHDVVWSIIRTALASPANLSMIPMQDLLALDTSDRFNTPGTLDGNWSWRMNALPDMENDCWVRSKEMNRLYGRSCK
ncbi:MAG: 4-alpha-glucanotransferase [Mariprofundaceae bacterium]|nr:4-alpha-glucanotransferase [Mariprofundaceae bacterium]